MKLLISVLFFFSSSAAFAALLAPPADLRNSSSQLEVLPPMGFLGCEECEKQFMGGVKGASSAQMKNAREHINTIWDAKVQAGAKDKSIKGN